MSDRQPWQQTKDRRERLKQQLAEALAIERARPRRSFRHHARVTDAEPTVLYAYDLETTRIAAGTPRPLYITGYGDGWSVDMPCDTMPKLARILIVNFLTDDKRGAKFVAWNGNRFDAYLVAISLLTNRDYVIVPYMTRSHQLRGLRIQRADDPDGLKGWEFTCGIAMLGLEGVSLEKFLKNFAPAFKKMSTAIDFEKEEFDSHNKAHRAYAFRDSEGLWHGMRYAQQIMVDTFNAPLAVTMGAICIKIFQANIPDGVYIKPLDATSEGIFRDYVMRGGFCFCNQRYTGPVWKYDVNQAYAAAMRESPMPCGDVLFNSEGVHPTAVLYIAQVEASNPNNKVPFYYRTMRGTRLQSDFALHRIDETWLTSIEVDQLRSEGWFVIIKKSYQWFESFLMSEFVNRLERLRATCEGGPKGAIGTMVKATGCHAYGKTVEESSPLEFVIADQKPTGFEPYFGEEGDCPIEHVWVRFAKSKRPKDYHAVQIGAFITAAVRMKVRRAALLSPETWLYADTDCVMFSSDVTDQLDIDPVRYGAWKIEESGTRYRVIAKKVYSEVLDDPQKFPEKRSAKGLNVKRLRDADYERWSNGEVPVQNQVQRNNFLAVSQSAEMFRDQVRRGTSVKGDQSS